MLRIVHPPPPEPITTFSPGALDLWRRIMKIRYARTEANWGDDTPPGQRGEYLSAIRQLSNLLGLPPWASLPQDASYPTPPDWITSEEQRADYVNAHRLYLLLQAAVAVEDARFE